MWLSKDKNGKVHLSIDKPERGFYCDSWCFIKTNYYLLIPKSRWKEFGCENLKWEDEPVKVNITK